MAEWFDEMLHPEIGQRLRIDRILYREKTEHQDLIIFENPLFGRILALDGVVQTTEGDEYIYHEMLAHVPVMAHGAASRVLIIGGGDGGMAREVLRHPDIAVTMVELDSSVVDLCREYMPAINAGAFDDPRLDLRYADGARFVHDTDETWDIIIVDSTDPIGPGEVLFRQEFYEGCKSSLTDGGILVTQNGCPFVQGEEITQSYRRLSPAFIDVHFYLAPVPTYQGGHMAFGWASDNSDLRRITEQEIARRWSALNLATRYYTPAVHVAAFALPGDILKLMA